jgi:Helix-turn-helix.
MITREELLKSSEYWIETIQNKVFSDVSEYIEKNNVSNKIIAERLGLSKGRVSQILSGENLNFRIDTLVKLCLAIGRVPDFRLVEINNFLTRENSSDESVVFTNDIGNLPLNTVQYYYAPLNPFAVFMDNNISFFQVETDYNEKSENTLKVA